jgi:hypothetical protein
MQNPQAGPRIHITQANAGRFEAEDLTDKRFFIAGSVQDDTLSFIVVAELPDGSRGAVRGVEYFDAMMHHFQQAGTLINTIEGNWSIHSPDLTTNIDVFNRLTASGLKE